MASFLLSGSPPIPVTLRRSPRARRYSLRVSRLDGRVTLTIPTRGSAAEAEAFARSREPWVRAQLARLAPAERVDYGSQLPVEGRAARVVAVDGPRGALMGDLIEVPAGVTAPGRHVEVLLKTLARDRLAEACDRYAEELGRPYARLSLRDTRSRWGSCSSNGSLMFSWRLVMAPPEILDYVAAHEVAHLAEMNHSARYWAIVERLCPGYDAPRGWLRQHGGGLHRYRFRD